MANHKFWKVAAGLTFLCLSTGAFAQIGTLSEGACWYDSKDVLKVASFNDKTVYNGDREQIEAEIEALLNHPKITEMKLFLHCGGYGASLVARVQTDSGTQCVWTRFEKGKLLPRSIGGVSEKSAEGALCDGHKRGEIIIGVNGREFTKELQGEKWSSIVKAFTVVSDKVLRVELMKEYEMKENEIASLFVENFAAKNMIRYVEFNEYHHPVGEYIPLK
jgi:hypothetical protein